MSRPPAAFVLPLFDGDPACMEVGGDLFYPDPGGQMEVAQAKAVCRGCEIRAACLKWALDNGEGWGIWGGLTELERRRLTGLRRRAS